MTVRTHGLFGCGPRARAPDALGRSVYAVSHVSRKARITGTSPRLLVSVVLQHRTRPRRLRSRSDAILRIHLAHLVAQMELLTRRNRKRASRLEQSATGPVRHLLLSPPLRECTWGSRLRRAAGQTRTHATRRRTDTVR